MFKNLLLILGSSILMVIATTLLHQGDFFDKIEPDTWGVYYSIIGVSFAMIAGLILVNELQRYTELRMLFQDEINAIQDMRDYLIFLDTTDSEHINMIKTSLNKYVQSVISIECEQMKLKQLNNSDTSPELYHLMSLIDNIEVNKKTDEIALEGIIGHLFSITTFRTKRFFLACERTHSSVMTLITVMAAFIVIGLMMMSIHDLFLHLFMVITTYISLFLLIILLRDISEPFNGLWKINMTSYHDYIKRADKEVL